MQATTPLIGDTALIHPLFMDEGSADVADTSLADEQTNVSPSIGLPDVLRAAQDVRPKLILLCVDMSNGQALVDAVTLLDSLRKQNAQVVALFVPIGRSSGSEVSSHEWRES